jgi:hypothetical protein
VPDTAGIEYDKISVFRGAGFTVAHRFNQTGNGSESLTFI